MNPDFIQIKQIDGELKVSRKKHDIGITVSTKELILQKPHLNYIIRFEDIVSILPYETAEGRKITFVSKKPSRHEVIRLENGLKNYKFYVRKATVHNRSGKFTTGKTEIVMPVEPNQLEVIAQYGGMWAM